MVGFQEAATARLHSPTTLRTSEVVPLPIYLVTRDTLFSVEDISPDINVAWLVATIMLGMEEKVVVFQAIRTSHRLVLYCP